MMFIEISGHKIDRAQIVGIAPLMKDSGGADIMTLQVYNPVRLHFKIHLKERDIDVISNQVATIGISPEEKEKNFAYLNNFQKEYKQLKRLLHVVTLPVAEENRHFDNALEELMEHYEAMKDFMLKKFPPLEFGEDDDCSVMWDSIQRTCDMAAAALKNNYFHIHDDEPKG